MNSDQWQKAKDLFEAALQCPPDKRRRFLDENCGGDADVRREVESLLAASDDAASFLEQPAVGEVAEIIAGQKSPAGKTLGHYKILQQIGAGGMGEVYLAKDKKLDRQVAIKILNEQFSCDDSNLGRFTQEAKSASSLNHPHILVIYEIGTDGDAHYIVSEFVEGKTLREHFKQSPMKLSEVLDVSIQIAGALTAAHAAHIIHRDIKPENIMVRPDGYVKILDFGLAKLVELQKSLIGLEDETAKQNQTAKGVILGTVNYMSPEQAKGERVDARSDIFSFGIVIYELITGRMPFAGDSVSETFANLINAEPQPLLRYAANVPDELQRIVSKMLRKNKDERYQTMKGLLADLKDTQQELEFQNKLERTNPPLREEAKTQIINAATTDAPHTPSSVKSVANEVKKHKFSFAVCLIVLLSAIGSGIWFFGNRAAHKTTIESIAVLPFVNESGNADVEYLSDGMTETLISSLSQIPKLNIKARSSVFRYKGKDTNAQTIGKELNVQAILNGTVVQRGQDLALHIELIDAQTESVLWSADYKQPMANLVSLQSEITRDVSGKLKIKLSGADEQKLTKNYTENAEAYRLYLKGRYYWYKFPAREFEKSRDYFQQAIDVDPTYALAYAGLAAYYGFASANGFLPPSSENWLKSESAVNKALALDDTLPDAYNALAGVTLYYYDDWAWTERELKRAIELNPNYAEARAHYARNLLDVGRSEEALAQMKKVLELEPLSVAYSRILARMLFQTREYDRAIEQYQKTIELDPNDAYTHELLGDTYEQKGMPKEAIAEWSKALRLTEDNEAAAMLERTFSASSFNAAARALWQKKLERFNEKIKRGEYVPAMNYALAYTLLADKEQAFAGLAKAEQERNRLKYDVKLDPIYDSLRDDPRFQDLLRRVGFPQ